MPRSYVHLSLKERRKIARWHEANLQLPRLWTASVGTVRRRCLGYCTDGLSLPSEPDIRSTHPAPSLRASAVRS